jgi:hypothetical protein
MYTRASRKVKELDAFRRTVSRRAGPGADAAGSVGEDLVVAREEREMAIREASAARTVTGRPRRTPYAVSAAAFPLMIE